MKLASIEFKLKHYTQVLRELEINLAELKANLKVETTGGGYGPIAKRLEAEISMLENAIKSAQAVKDSINNILVKLK